MVIISIFVKLDFWKYRAITLMYKETLWLYWCSPITKITFEFIQQFFILLTTITITHWFYLFNVIITTIRIIITVPSIFITKTVVFVIVKPFLIFTEWAFANAIVVVIFTTTSANPTFTYLFPTQFFDSTFLAWIFPLTSVITTTNTIVS